MGKCSTAYHAYMAVGNCDDGICSKPEPPPPVRCPECLIVR